ncbi:MAG: gliding motility-associated C-terminal domain-containing protein [Elusimicrobia bacterium]|nr:gliding motility-associated C-terminal domain-containing protein [Elusimicrobiota bacterium]
MKESKFIPFVFIIFSFIFLIFNFSYANWYLQTVDSTGDVGAWTSLVFDSNNHPHISYYDEGNKDLKYAAWTGTSWAIQTVDSAGDVGSYSSIAVDSNNYPHISYHADSNDLKYAKWTGTSWSIVDLDSPNVGQYTSIALDSNDYPHISYYDIYDKDLKYIRWTGASWSTPQAIDTSGIVGQYSSIAIDLNDNPHIAYYDAHISNLNLKYSSYTVNTNWSISTADAPNDVGAWASLDIDLSGNSHVSYYDKTNTKLRYGKRTGSSWSLQDVDTTGNAGEYSSIAVGSDNVPHISYYDAAANFDLKYSSFTDAWYNTTVDATGVVGLYTSIAVDAGNNPHISYQDSDNKDLKFAMWDAALPNAVTDLTALAGTSDGQIILQWTAPGDDGTIGKAESYIIRYATYQITDSDWDNAAVSQIASPPTPSLGGTGESFTVENLTAGNKYWFALKSLDNRPSSNISDISNSTYTICADFIPSAPQGLVGTSGNYRVSLDWKDNTEIDIAGYNVYRSVTSGSSYTKVSTYIVTSSQYDDVLADVKEYFYVVTAVDNTSHESSYSNEVSTVPALRLPKAPLRVSGNLNDSGDFVITWNSVTQNNDGTICSDLAAYNIYSANSLKGTWTQRVAVDTNTFTWTDTQTDWGLIYYFIRSANEAGIESENSMIIDSSPSGNITFMDMDSSSNPVVGLEIPKEISNIFQKEQNVYGEDVTIQITRKRSEEGPADLYIYEINALKAESNGVISSFSFPKSVGLIFYYQVNSGQVEKLNIPSESAASQLAILRHNNVEWINIGGDVDTASQEVNIGISHLSKYKLAGVVRATLFGEIRTEPKKIFTPNNDGIWDVMEFHYENPVKSDVIGKLYDMTGAFVANMTKGNTDSSLKWDGNYDSGDKAPSGVYIYSIEAEGRIINGTIVLAR